MTFWVFTKNKAEEDGWRLSVRRSEVKGSGVGLVWVLETTSGEWEFSC